MMKKKLSDFADLRKKHRKSIVLPQHLMQQNLFITLIQKTIFYFLRLSNINCNLFEGHPMRLQQPLYQVCLDLLHQN